MKDPARHVQAEVALWHAFVQTTLRYYAHIAAQPAELTHSMVALRGGEGAVREMVETGRLLNDLTPNQFHVLCGELTTPFDHAGIRRAAQALRRERREATDPAAYLAAALLQPVPGARAAKATR
jgi:hypothetical protein